MANVQSLFEQFHNSIRTYYEINEILRTKKDIIVERVQASLAKKNRPPCEPFIQGSYKMKVGICALQGSEFDIDVGLRFSFDELRYSPMDVRSWVFEAVDGHTETVEDKGPCIRVRYKDGYHVDLVPYAWWDDATGKEQHRLAHKTKGWRPADPPALVQFAIDARHPFRKSKDPLTQTDQFRRVVRFLKRWNDNALREESNDKPSGLALLLLTKLHLGGPHLTWDGASDDRSALEQVAGAAASTYGRVIATKPTPEGEDMFGRLSDGAMKDLKDRFGTMRDTLLLAKNAKDAKDACRELRRVFGAEFPCPDQGGRDDSPVRKTLAPAVVPSSSSA